MDRLKQFIEDNRKEFENESLPTGHEMRFSRKLESKKKLNPFINIGIWIAAAAAVFLLFLLPHPEKESSQLLNAQKSQVCETAKEIQELRIYYQMQINDIIAQMENLYKQNKTPGTDGLLKETQTVLAANKRFDQTELPELPCSNEGVYAITQHYNNSLESLSIMLKQMKNITSEKN